MPTDLFKQVDIDKIAADLHIVERAEEAAKQGLPLLDSTDLNNVEEGITSKISKHQSDAKDKGEKELDLIRKRLFKNDEDLIKDSDSIGDKISTSRRQLKGIAEKAYTALREKADKLKQAEGRLTIFQKKHNLHREADKLDQGKKVLLLGIIALLFLIETLGNASFLAKGNELGLFGAYTEAIVISFANLGIALLLGWLTTNCHHIELPRKSVGILAAIVFLVFAFFFNLMVAHYREITGTILDEGGQLAMSAFLENPLGLREFQSWMLFCMGFLFAIISFIDGIKLAGDPYPGYSKVFFACEDLYKEYRESYEGSQEELKTKLNEAVKSLHSIKQKLTGSERERASILDSHRYLVKSYEDHLDYLERAGNDLLELYREANRARRGGEAPTRFDNRWKMEPRLPIHSTLPEDLLKSAEIEKRISDTKVNADNGEKELQKEYDNLSRDLRQLAPHRRSQTTQ